MCKRNSLDKNEASTKCVRETPQTKVKQARGVSVRETQSSDKNEASTGSVRETHQIKMKPAWDVYWMKPLSTGCVRETLLILFCLFIFLSACPAAPPKGAEQDKHKMMIEQPGVTLCTRCRGKPKLSMIDWAWWPQAIEWPHVTCKALRSPTVFSRSVKFCTDRSAQVHRMRLLMLLYSDTEIAVPTESFSCACKTCHWHVHVTSEIM